MKDRKKNLPKKLLNGSLNTWHHFGLVYSHQWRVCISEAKTLLNQITTKTEAKSTGKTDRNVQKI